MPATHNELDVTRFYCYDELTAVLQGFARDYPTLATLDTLGRSHVSRELWVLSVTNSATAPAVKKPAMYIDGTIHAGEVTGTNRGC